MKQIERWGMYEWTGAGRTDGNPFVDCDIRGLFHTPYGDREVAGFYDGDGRYCVRFMPEFEGEYTCQIRGSFSDQTYGDSFVCTPARPGNHGPVRVRGEHFEYSDGTPYLPFGTTCYVWELQDEATQAQTLEELGKGCFNKIRYCVFPKHYLYNLNEPASYPYEGTPCRIDPKDEDSAFRAGAFEGNSWDFTRFNPEHFHRVERSIMQLQALGIEADLIMMHPYDRWGFSEMPGEADDLYWRYALARFSAFRNVWWSLANEYDLLKKKTIADWERFAGIILENDPYAHPRSIHNCITPYDQSRPWITHLSLQRTDLYKSSEYVDEYRARFRKPVVMDEICYEGNIDQGWGAISGQELVRRFWEAAMRGGYASHGETFENPEGVLWWSHGGRLHGESPERIRFLREILSRTPGGYLRRWEGGAWDEVAATSESPDQQGRYVICYYGFNRPSSRLFRMPQDKRYKVEIIDTWNMTIQNAGVCSGTFRISLPGREYMAIRLTETDDGAFGL